MEQQVDTPALTDAEAAAAEVAYVKGEISQTRIVSREEAEALFPPVEDKPTLSAALLQLIHRQVYMALRQLPTKGPAFSYDRQPITMAEVTESAKEAGITLHNCRPILIIRDVMRRTGMRLAL